MTDIHYKNLAGRDAHGRNGFIRQHGLHIENVYGELLLHPIHSKGGWSAQCRMVIPIEHAHDVAVALMEFALFQKA